MRSSRLARALAHLYSVNRLRARLRRVIARLEGGELTSLTLREVLASRHGIVVGNYSYGSLLDPMRADPQLTIGHFVSVGPGVRRFGANHPLQRLSMNPYSYNPALGVVGEDRDVERTACVISDDVWIGAESIILTSCRRIGLGAVVGAGSVVTRDVGDFQIVAGNPARVLGTRLDESAQGSVRAIRFEALSPRELDEVVRGYEESVRGETSSDH